MVIWIAMQEFCCYSRQFALIPVADLKLPAMTAAATLSRRV
jgi:hypothetical protein